MPYKDIQKRRAAHKRYYLKNKILYKNKNVNRRLSLAKFVISLKQKACVDCGIHYPHYIMDFDHIDAKDKLKSIAHLIKDGFSEKKILIEMKKCELVCSNCHRERTYQRLIKNK